MKYEKWSKKELIRELENATERIAELEKRCAVAPLQSGADALSIISHGDRFRDLAKLLPAPVLNSEAINEVEDSRDFNPRLIHAQKMEAVGTLAGGIAHDFNNILTSIIASASLIQRHIDESSPMRRHLDRIFASAERAAILTQSILAYSRKQSSQPAPVKLNLIAANLHKLLTRLVPENINITITAKDGDLPVMADSGQIEQVVMNLVSNAIDAMPDGGRLDINTSCVTPSTEGGLFSYMIPGRYAVLAVADSGVGMDTTVRESLFQPFFTTKELGHGTGLGLAVVYGIVKQHGGYIHVQSEPGQGAVFSVFLPLLERESSNLLDSELLSYPRGKETILLIEDDHDVRNLLKEILESYGYSVIEAEDGSDGVNKFLLHSTEVDLILSDVMMPGKNGKEAYNEIRKSRSDVKAIFISGYSYAATKELLDEGMDFLAKPVSPRELLAKIREALDR